MSFIYAILNRIPEKDSIDIIAEIEFKQDNNYKNDFLMEYLLSDQRPITQTLDMEKIVESDFLPMSIFLESMSKDHLTDEQVQWIRNEGISSIKRNIKYQKKKLIY